MTPDPRTAPLRAMLADRTPVDDREAESLRRIVAELDRLAAPFAEEADPVHVTGSAIVVGPRGVLLLKHKRLGIWLQPGGHVDGDESAADAAVREATEETGLAARHPDGGPHLVHVDVHQAAKGHTHLDVRYLVEVPDDDPRPPADESQDVRWFGWDEALAIADDGLRGALEALRP